MSDARAGWVGAMSPSTEHDDAVSELPIPSELVADLAERMSGRRWETTHAYNAIVALRAMPVEQRMALMNMVERRASFDGQTFSRCWTEDYS